MPTNESSDRTRCLIYTRCMWYLAPTYRYNIWKKWEFFSRKYFSKKKMIEKCEDIVKNNKEFNKQYS